MKNKLEICSTPHSSIYDEIISWVFPGGEVGVRLPDIVSKDNVIIKAILTSSDDVMKLIMTVDALRNIGIHSIALEMPYIPYARQDRMCNKGESFSIRTFAYLLNSLGFQYVRVMDPHSEVSSKLINNCEVIRQSMAWSTPALEFLNSNENIYLVAPDKGATEKTKAHLLDWAVRIKGIVQADKVRDPTNGSITGISVISKPADISDANFIIVDDICDGGKTFIELAKVLKEYNPASISLYVTHGIFSKGKQVLRDAGISNIWCAIDFEDYK